MRIVVFFLFPIFILYVDELTPHLNKLKHCSLKNDSIEIGPMENNDDIQQRKFDKKSSFEPFA